MPGIPIVPGFDSRTMIYPLIDEILKAGRDILSYQRVRVNVPLKRSWEISQVHNLRRDGPGYALDGDQCKGCDSLSYYDVVQ